VKMTHDSELKLQAYVDGELSGAESASAERLISEDQAAGALVAELRNTRGALRGNESVLTLPETREFYWSQIQRRIQAEAPARPAKPATSIADLLRRFLVPAGALAALGIFCLLSISELQSPSGRSQSELALADPAAFTYRDFESGTTLVWLSYPADNDYSEDEFADGI